MPTSSDERDPETGLLIASSRDLRVRAARLRVAAALARRELHELLARVRNTAHVAMLHQHLYRRLVSRAAGPIEGPPA